MSRQTKAVIDTAALLHNFKIIKQRASAAKVWAVVKANAYGHGMIQVAKVLSSSTDGFAVARFEEGVELRESGVTQPILLLEGITELHQISQSRALNFELVVHQQVQLEQLLSHPCLNTQDGLPPQKIWLKMDSGMHRLGIPARKFASLVEMLQSQSHQDQILLAGILTHFACGDDPDHPLNG